MRNIFIALYLVAILAANVITAAITPLNFAGFIVPAGTFVIGTTFILRDMVQRYVGRRHTYAIIAVALALSAVTSYALGDTLWIVGASAVTFAISETLDTEIYTRLKTTLACRVLFSGIIGGTADSAIFVIVGLSPLGAGFLPWAAVPSAILGQIVVKTAMQFVGAGVISALDKR